MGRDRAGLEPGGHPGRPPADHPRRRGLADRGGTLVGPDPSAVSEHRLPPFRGTFDIVPAALGELVVVHGALASARSLLQRNASAMPIIDAVLVFLRAVVSRFQQWHRRGHGLDFDLFVGDLDKKRVPICHVASNSCRDLAARRGKGHLERPSEFRDATKEDRNGPLIVVHTPKSLIMRIVEWIVGCNDTWSYIC